VIQHVNPISKGGATGITVPAQIDTAADLAVIPGRLVEELQLVPLDAVVALGFGGHLLTDVADIPGRTPGEGVGSGHGQSPCEPRRTVCPARQGRPQPVHDLAGRAETGSGASLKSARQAGSVSES